MSEKVYKAYAKINITLDVLGKRDDGYHELEMIMQNVDLYDVVTVKKREGGIVLSSSRKDLPLDKGNIAYRAAELMFEKYGVQGGIEIDIEKHIPVAAGLAGGSTDGAAVIKAVNDLYELGLGEEELKNCASQIGSDIPYCVAGKTSLATGRGTDLTYLAPMPKMYVVLAKPDIDVSTAFVYKNYKAENVEKRPETARMVDAVNRGDTKTIAEGLCNVLESVTTKHYPIINEIKAKFIECGAVNSLMSGSGPTVFAVFEEKETADKAAEEIKSIFGIEEVYSVATV